MGHETYQPRQQPWSPEWWPWPEATWNASKLPSWRRRRLTNECEVMTWWNNQAIDENEGECRKGGTSVKWKKRKKEEKRKWELGEEIVNKVTTCWGRNGARDYEGTRAGFWLCAFHLCPGEVKRTRKSRLPLMAMGKVLDRAVLLKYNLTITPLGMTRIEP